MGGQTSGRSGGQAAVSRCSQREHSELVAEAEAKLAAAVKDKEETLGDLHQRHSEHVAEAEAKLSPH